MTCQQIKENIPDILSGELDSSAMAGVNAHLSECPSCREEIENLSEMWVKLGVLPEEQPDTKLRKRFYSMLKSFQKDLKPQQQRITWQRWFARTREYLIHPRPIFQFTLPVLVVLVGFIAGYTLASSRTVNLEIRSLKHEIRNIRQSAAISMLQQESASDRLNGISWSTMVENPDEDTLKSLLHVLNHDPSTNVRLAAVDALFLFSDNKLVKHGLIQSLSRQQAPIVQVALIDLLVDIRGRKAVQALKQLMARKIINPEVRDFAENSLQKLIGPPKKVTGNKQHRL